MCFLLPLKKDKNVWHLQAISSSGDPRLSCLLPSQWLLGSLHSFFQPEKQKCKSVNNLACTVLWTKRKTDTQHSCLQKVSSVTTVVAKEAGNVILLLIILLINRIGSITITVEKGEYEFRWNDAIYIISSSCFTGLLGWGKETEKKQGNILNIRGNNIL